MDNLYIFKFGGSCLKNKESFAQSLKILRSYIPKGNIIAVTSAIYGVTNQLLKWIETIEQSNSSQIATEELRSIFDLHKEYVNDNIQDSGLRNESNEFLKEKHSELEILISKHLGKKFNPEMIDFVSSFGERLSTFIFSRFLKDNQFESSFLSADDNLIITDEIFGKALPNLEKTKVSITERVIPLLIKGEIPTFSGFYGCTEEGKITTLGRGGTDFTATIVAFSLAEKYKIKVVFWKDVYGLMSANPKFEPHSKILKHISFSEAKELAFFGSKVLHPLCLNTAEKSGVEVELRNFDDPFDEKCTLISKQLIEEDTVIKAVTTIENIAMITVEGESMVSLPGAAAKLFSIIGNNNININFISQSSSENNITFGVTEADGFMVGQILAESTDFGKRWMNIRVDHNVSLVATVGSGMARTPGIAGKVFTVLGNSGINVCAIAQGSSEMNISFVIKRKDLGLAIRELYHKFIETNEITTSFW